MRAIPICLTLTAALAAIPAAEAASPPEHRITYDNLFAARVNPLGLIEYIELAYQQRLYLSDSPLFDNNFVSVGVRPAITPAWARIQAVLRVQPTSFMQVWAEYAAGGHFGSFGLMQSFRYADAPFNDTIRDQGEEAGLNYAATGTQIGLGVLLQAKVGPIAARSSTRFIRGDHDLREGDTAYYDIIYDLVIPDEGWASNTDTDLLYLTDFGLTAGVRWTFNAVFARETDLDPNRTTPGNPNSPYHRIGPLVAYTFFNEPGAAFDQPTVMVLANWWLKHRFRTGEDVSQALPYIILGFSFRGDLWRSE